MENDSEEMSNVPRGTIDQTSDIPQIPHPDEDHLPVENVDYQKASAVNLSPTVEVDKDNQLQEPSEDAEWYYADGVPGTGPKPDFFNSKTFKTLFDQARAQNEARKQLGSFTGAPDEGYELNVDESLNELGLNEEDVTLNAVADIAQELNMSQEGFDRLLNVYGNGMKEALDSLTAEEETQYQEELKKLGPNGKEDLKLIKQWCQNNIPDDLHQEFYGMLTSAGRVKIFVDLMDKIVPTRLSHVPPGTGLSRQHLLEMMKDPKYLTDTDYQRHVDSEAENLYGVRKI